MAKARKQSSQYWEKRMAALEDEQYRRSAAYYKDVQEQYRRAANNVQMDIDRWYQRLADNNDISYAGAKRLLKKNELEEFKWTVEQYIKAGEQSNIDGSWIKELENASARHHISYLEAMKIQMQQHAELLSTEFEGGMTDFLHKAYGTHYYRSAYEMAKGTGVGSNLAKLDTRRIDNIIRRPWAQDGANFSDRIWTNKQKLINSLHTELTQNIIRGDSPQNAIDNLAKTMNVSRSQAGRLIATESAAISSAAQRDCFKELGVEKYEILATLDSRTSEICQELDGKVFDMKDFRVGETAPPFHPNCRSTTVPHFDDEFTVGEERAAYDDETGKTYYVPADMTYSEWQEQYVELPKDADGAKIKLSDNEVWAVNSYVSFDSYPLNDALRNGLPLDSRMQMLSDNLDTALEKSPRYNGDLGRSMHFSDPADAKVFFDSLEVSGEITFMEYISTTKNGVYNEDALVQIYIQNSKKGRDISDVNISEQEVLYERGSRFRVVNKAKMDDVYHILFEEV